MDVWINETGKEWYPGQAMTASLTAGCTTSKVRKNITERGNRPSKLEDTQPANDPLFVALSKERVLVFVGGPSP